MKANTAELETKSQKPQQTTESTQKLDRNKSTICFRFYAKNNSTIHPSSQTITTSRHSVEGEKARITKHHNNILFLSCGCGTSVRKWTFFQVPSVIFLFRSQIQRRRKRDATRDLLDCRRELESKKTSHSAAACERANKTKSEVTLVASSSLPIAFDAAAICDARQRNAIIAK